MKCYFCDLNLIATSGNHYHCYACQSKYQLDMVVTTYSNISMIYVHVYATLKGKQYHIRYHVKEDFTTILHDNYPDLEETILTLNKIPFTLNNVIEKLKLYLLFS